MKGIQSKHLRKKLRDRRLKLTSAGRWNQNFDITIRLTNIAPKWKYGLKYAKGNIYMMDSWEEIRVNIVISGVSKQREYVQCDGNDVETTRDVPITDWHRRESTWCNKNSRRRIRNTISDAEYNTHNATWVGGIGIQKLLQLFGIPSQNVKIGTIRFED